MKNCCQDISTITCSIVDIQKRIEPIEFVNNNLVIDSSISVEDLLVVGAAQISIVNNKINLPAKTLINGTPLLADAFINDIISLPTSTIIDGYFPITEQFYYFYTATDGVFGYRGYIVNGEENPVSTRTASQVPRGYSFLAPEDCVLSSLKIILTFQAGSYSGTSPIASVLIDVLDTNLVVYYTGFYMDVPAPTSNTIGRVFAEQEFEYFVRKGDCVGVWVQDNLLVSGSMTAYAVLGFKVLPPQALLTTFYTQGSTSTYNRFPFNNIMNSMANRSTNIYDQLAVLRSAKSSFEVYGRPMTTRDLDTRYSSETIDHAETAFFFSKKKIDGWYVDISSSFNNTQNMGNRYKWRGILIGKSELDDPRPLSFYIMDDVFSVEIMLLNNIPSVVEYLSLDISDDATMCLDILDKFPPILDQFTFSFISVRHDLNQDIQWKAAYLFFSHGYTRIFTDMVIHDNQTYEDWYAHPSIHSPIFLERISEHSRNHGYIPFSECVEIIQDAHSQ